MQPYRIYLQPLTSISINSYLTDSYINEHAVPIIIRFLRSNRIACHAKGCTFTTADKLVGTREYSTRNLGYTVLDRLGWYCIIHAWVIRKRKESRRAETMQKDMVRGGLAY